MARQEMLTVSFWSRLMAPPSEEREAAARLGYVVSLAYIIDFAPPNFRG